MVKILLSRRIADLAVSATDLFAGTSDGVYLSTNDGDDWTPVNTGLSKRDVRALAVSGTNLYAGTWDGGVFRSINNGANWTPVNTGLTDPDVLSFTLNGTNIITGTWGGGAFYSTDNGANWTGMSAGLMNTVLYSLVTDGTNLYAGTRVGSVWRRPLLEVGVQIAGFDARASRSGVELTWDITSDVEIEGFNIYRSDDGREFKNPRNSRGLIPPEARSYIDRDIHAGSVYRYTLAVVPANGSGIQSRTATVKVQAWALALYQNHPNPFNPATTISFTLPDRTRVNLSVFNVEGKLVKALTDDVMNEGFKEITWDGTDANGTAVSSGVYFYRLKAGKQVLTRKMVLLK